MTRYGRLFPLSTTLLPVTSTTPGHSCNLVLKPESDLGRVYIPLDSLRHFFLLSPQSVWLVPSLGLRSTYSNSLGEWEGLGVQGAPRTESRQRVSSAHTDTSLFGSRTVCHSRVLRNRLVSTSSDHTFHPFFIPESTRFRWFRITVSFLSILILKNHL